MPTDVRTNSEKFYNEITHGLDISASGNTADFFHGSAAGNYGAEIEFYAFRYVEIPDDEYRTVIEDSGTTIRVFSEIDVDYNAQGFKVGDTVHVFFERFVDVASNTFFEVQGFLNLTILEIGENQIKFNSIFLMPPSDGTVISSQNILIVQASEYNGAYYRYGVIENEEENNNLSKLTLESQSFYKDSITDSFSFGEVSGSSKSWQSLISHNEEYFQIKKNDRQDVSYNFQEIAVSLTNGVAVKQNEGLPIDGVAYSFTTFHKSRIPFYTEEEKTNLQNGIPPEDLKGDNSFRYYGKIELRRSLSDPNFSMEIETNSDTKGSVGFQEETFNGINPQFSLINYFITNAETGDIDTDIDLAGSEIQINIQTPNEIGAVYRASLFYSMLTDESVYLDRKRFSDENLRIDKISGIPGDSFSPGPNEIISDITISDQGSGIVRITASLNPNAGSPDVLASEGEDYMISVIMGKTGVPAENSLMTRLDIKFGQFIQNTDIDGLLDVETLQFKGMDKVIGENYEGANQDPITILSRFGTDFSQGTLIRNLKSQFIGFNPISESFFLIKSNDILFDEELVSGIQRINLDTVRGFNAFDEEFNVLKLVTDTQSGVFQYYDFEYSTKIPFRENVKIDVPDEFYDPNGIASNFFGRNQKASNYSGVNGYVVKYLLRMDLVVGDISTDYGVFSDDLIIVDYDEQV